MALILTIVGARPQFIKAAPVSLALATAGLSEYLVHTGQHYDPLMSGTFFKELEIKEPDINLQISGGSHGEQTAGMLTKIERVIKEQKPDCVLVYGDTNSTLAGSLAACKLKIPIAHVEAGLRSFNRGMPEEINRIVTDVVSSIWFVPTTIAAKNLLREGISGPQVILTGDVMYDSLLHFQEKARIHSTILKSLGLESGPYALATIHRAENTDDLDRLILILQALETVALRLRVVLPLHPRTRARLSDINFRPSKVEIIEPVGFLDMIQLEASAKVIATDSGGVQKEAYFHKVPCVTLRDETEWIELIDSGWNRLAPPNRSTNIADSILAALESRGENAELYGRGDASSIIAAALQQHFAKRS